MENYPNTYLCMIVLLSWESETNSMLMSRCHMGGFSHCLLEAWKGVSQCGYLRACNNQTNKNSKQTNKKTGLFDFQYYGRDMSCLKLEDMFHFGWVAACFIVGSSESSGSYSSPL